LSNYFDPNSENQQKELLKIDLKNFKLDSPAQVKKFFRVKFRAGLIWGNRKSND